MLVPSGGFLAVLIFKATPVMSNVYSKILNLEKQDFCLNLDPSW